MSTQEPLRYDDEEVTPENPVRDRLERLHEDFSTEASQKEARAGDLEQEAAMLRAEARGLRTAAEGVSHGIKGMQEAYAKNAEVFAETLAGYTEEGRFVGPEKVRRRRVPEVGPRQKRDDGYDARAHANRYP